MTKNERLSADELLKRSAINVHNPTNELRRFYTDNSFTIYEGGWGYPYVAKFEVWYKPNNGKEIWLTETDFKIEGWQR